MQQRTLPFHYAEENESTGMTALSGLPAYLDLAAVARLGESVRRHVGVREGTQGWTDAQMVMSLVMLNLSGGESVDDPRSSRGQALRLLERDEGLGRVLLAGESHRMRRVDRRAQRNRWRKERRRVVPSPTAVFRYLDNFHDEAEEARRRPGRAFIPAANDALRGLGKVNSDLVGFAGGHSGHTRATLDMDATLVETHKRQANYCYKKYKAYQPLTTYWHEADLVVHSEFRDGNVNAGYEQLRVLKDSLEHLPSGVSKVMMRSDSAGYQKELLKYCAEGRDERFGVIEFCVGVDVMPEFKAAVKEVEEDGWHDLHRTEEEHRERTGQQYAEVCYVTDWTGYSKNSPDYRFIAIREPLRNPRLFDMEELPVPTMQMGDGTWYKVTGVVTNRDLPGDELIRWYRRRCGKGEEVHSVLKEDLAGGRLPSGKFGSNAAWWAIAVLAFNLNSAMKWLVLGGQWVSKRLKAVRFGIINLAGRVVRNARKLIIRLARGHPSYDLLVSARQRIAALANAPPRA